MSGEIKEYLQNLVEGRFKPSTFSDQSDSEVREKLFQRICFPSWATNAVFSMAVVYHDELERELKEKKIAYADHENIVTLACTMLFHECFKTKKGTPTDEWPGIDEIEVLKSAFRAVKSLG